MGQIRQARSDAYLRLIGVSDDLVVGRSARDRNFVSIMIGCVGASLREMYEMHWPSCVERLAFLPISRGIWFAGEAAVLSSLHP
jgi:hypothetical protein